MKVYSKTEGVFMLKKVKAILTIIFIMVLLGQSPSITGINQLEGDKEYINFYTYMGNNERNAFSENIEISLPIESKWSREIGLDPELLPYYPYEQWPIMSKEFLYITVGRGILRINKSSGIYSYNELDYISNYPLTTSLTYSQNERLLFVPCYCFDQTEGHIDIFCEKYLIEKRKIVGYRPYNAGIPVVIDDYFLVWHTFDDEKCELVKFNIANDKTETIFTLDLNEYPLFLTVPDSSDKIIITTAMEDTSKKEKTYISKYILKCIDLKSKILLWSHEIDNEEGYVYLPPDSPFISGSNIIIGLKRGSGDLKLEIISINISTGEILWKKEFRDHKAAIPNFSSCATDNTLYISGTFGNSNKVFSIDAETGKTKMEIPLPTDSSCQITGSKNYIIHSSYNPAKLSFINCTTGEIEFEYNFDDNFRLASPIIFDEDGLYVFLTKKTDKLFIEKLFVEKLGPAKF